jgi:uncharacterized protein
MKIGRNDPCHCGSGKKYKQCCMVKDAPGGSTKKKFKATWLSGPKPVNLIERTFGEAINQANEEKPHTTPKYLQNFLPASEELPMEKLPEDSESNKEN